MDTMPHGFAGQDFRLFVRLWPLQHYESPKVFDRVCDYMELG